MHEGRKESMKKWMHKWKIILMKEWMNKLIKEPTNNLVNKISEWMNKPINEKGNNERKEWGNEV